VFSDAADEAISDEVVDRVGRGSLYVALLAAWTAMMGSLYFSEIRGFVPCELCWVQRILMYPLAGIIALGVLRQDVHLPYLVLPFSLIGQGVSTYHYLLQKTDLFAARACTVGVPCSATWINWFGFVTIPFLAMVAFLVITLAMLVALSQGVPDPEDHRPQWHRRELVPVAGVAIFSLAWYSALALNQATAGPTAEPSTFEPAPLRGPLTPAGEDPMALLEGERLYQEVCASCHGMDGRGLPGLGNSLVDSPFVRERSEEELVAMVRAGRPADAPDNRSGVAMPPSGGRPDLTDEQLGAIVRVIRAWNP